MNTTQTDEQRMNALCKANRIRTAKKNLKIEAKQGRRMVSEIIATLPEEAAKAKLADALTWAPGIGRVKAANICRSLRITPNRRLDALHPLERKRVVTRVVEYESRRAEKRARGGRVLAAA